MAVIEELPDEPQSPEVASPPEAAPTPEAAGGADVQALGEQLAAADLTPADEADFFHDSLESADPSALKDIGNRYFAQQRFADAIDCYLQALDILGPVPQPAPKEEPPGAGTGGGSGDLEAATDLPDSERPLVAEPGSDAEQPKPPAQDPAASEPSSSDPSSEAPAEAADEHESLPSEPAEIRALRISLLNNLSICEAKLENLEAAIHYCSMVLDLDRDNGKARLRRASYREKSSDLLDLSGALEDYDEYLRLFPADRGVKRTRDQLEPRVKAEQERLQAEMLSKLRGLGDSILGRFGMSIDQFKFEKDENTGSYSLKFEQGRS
ncbi:hypothetical protein H696_02490 [Fonticula alba]|uniref:Uncharacterized protein n=1 Tax=Fonticula alba TaxID=691883 RepID=A0A058ZAV2_FONAL|nr:hypothetical protein H696_02490 [Fonticula alba]KCV71550.1 hypothetical protein H696_02490 [Fonticula alba]|eukprot:XP_009494673.1 hypothetical protein H696_02490 [Fonticula alba]